MRAAPGVFVFGGADLRAGCHVDARIAAVAIDAGEPHGAGRVHGGLVCGGVAAHAAGVLSVDIRLGLAFGAGLQRVSLLLRAAGGGESIRFARAPSRRRLRARGRRRRAASAEGEAHAASACIDPRIDWPRTIPSPARSSQLRLQLELKTNVGKQLKRESFRRRCPKSLARRQTGSSGSDREILRQRRAIANADAVVIADRSVNVTLKQQKLERLGVHELEVVYIHEGAQLRREIEIRSSVIRKIPGLHEIRLALRICSSADRAGCYRAA